jgi:hypothetical protein
LVRIAPALPLALRFCLAAHKALRSPSTPGQAALLFAYQNPTAGKDLPLALQLRKNGDDDINELKNREPRPLELVLLKNRRDMAYQAIDLDYWPEQNYFAEV